MRVFQLTRNPKVYTCRSYLLLGDWNQLDDVNTLIDPGTDDFTFSEIDRISTGCGKVPVEQVLLTHNHFDHAASADLFRQRYGARVYAWVDGPGVDHLLHEGQILRAGDDYLEVIHTPGHSSDSIAFYCQAEKLLFSGDTQLRIRSSGGKYTQDYVQSLLKLSQRHIDLVYPGHDEPFTHDVQSIILETLKNVRNSNVV
ncbi:MBL fold metallo-hydrolase [Trichlorobacter ammonificans]|uniref:Glyoxylase, beta-lactamase superfamily II n=1 Tax=Trichlorobacter ammonificans TaxID=2916410 RepID=A0ABN8HJ29_9BACT|nr:MBL fold metallo-hydrolase [Trichlorobacter ammonificans]CAH2031224.1 Glyoxylase, beta-lactamase superfamily II [Trichlorobacter ammonificans]